MHERMTDVAIVVLAAGLGTRMKSARPKVLHEIAGRSMLGHVLAAARELAPARVVVVTGPDAPGVAEEARRWMPQARTVVQHDRLGTAHAVMQALPEIEDHAGHVLVLYGDVPLITPQTLKRLQAASAEAELGVLAFEAADPTGYGRIIRDGQGRPVAIREEADASAAERNIRLCNSGIMSVNTALLRRLLPRVDNDNAKGEYYLTDLLALAVAEGATTALALCPEEEVQGVNDRVQLAAAEAVMQQRLRTAAMAAGVTMQDPATVHLSYDTVLEPDVEIEPCVWFGPGVRVGRGARIRAFSHLEQAEVGAGASIGPFARLRPEARIHEGARIGNFVEIKKADVEPGAKVNHFTYIGDARVGARANIGAGTITCNYDGFSKHFTDIGEEAFIGSNSALVAPVRIGRGAYVGSGSVITEDVPPEALAIARARQVNKPGWAARFREAMRRRRQRRS
jgi:bifunctional UDP-N-acetylglucosamine pyrophosphorylase/glucosamine-1-phosphate N-acetyltransferase